MVKKLYLASSWRNAYQPGVLAELRVAGFEVYDFRNPAPGNSGFSWSQCDSGLIANLSVDRMRSVLAHPVARSGFSLDAEGMAWADACVLLLPSGMSAHLEAGWIGGSGRPVVVLAPEIREPELMYKLFDKDDATPLYATIAEVVSHLRGIRLAP